MNFLSLHFAFFSLGNQCKTRDSSYVTKLLFINHIMYLLYYNIRVSSQDLPLINWSFAFMLCNIIGVLQRAINHSILLFILESFGTFFINWAEHCGRHYRVIFQQIQQMALKCRHWWCWKAAKWPSWMEWRCCYWVWVTIVMKEKYTAYTVNRHRSCSLA